MRRNGCASYVSVRNRGALAAHDGADLAALRSGVEVFSGALEGDSLHTALDTNLLVEINMTNKHLLKEDLLKY